ncbi:MAG: hypothetical protein GWN00_24380 [Aliifodinibius sp.]|nr:hypothetical protein [candidate division Zixibacteria bacterium]NIT59242.1 hypothetical protein [Fodinibius sp.]NIW40503.1 hypothetical protein [candidate division Zixibacteria bacterium]NIX57826.1 hypothetical protein [candidate division Zixibacteria bacterium]NIY27825.1 hypothetical protein [Fodinibius sp.]
MHWKNLPFILLVSGLVLLLSAPDSTSQVSVGGEPPSFSRLAKDNIHTITMGYVDVEVLLAEDSIDEENGLPPRFGYPFKVNYDLENSGTWETLPDGSRLWRLRIACPGAYSINLIYDHFWLPEGARLFLYNDDHSMVLGAFTPQNNKSWDEFATGLVKGDICYLEYHEPADVESQGIISISSIIHGYKNLFNSKEVDGILGFGDSGSCNNNVNCPEGLPWQDEKRAVAMILTSGGSRLCSGSLINNARSDLTPFFLTANHCLPGASTWVFMFNYESPTCDNIDGPTWMTVSGSTLRANNSYSDFALLELAEAPPDSYEVFYAGWSRIDTAASSAVAIHHPSGDIKKISFEYDPLASTSYLGGPGSGDSHWRVEDWDDGTTEPGSSGSPLYDPNHRVVGQLHGGYASCTSQTPDWYGKFSKSWDYGSSASTRLKEWLDPDNTGVWVIDGVDATGVSITHTPLEDTKDNVNDYEVVCEITSNADLVTDSLLLYYEINTVWTDVQLTFTGTEDTYNAFIPAQPSGTTVNYYLFAKNIDGDADTTDTFSFYVIDYDVILDPLSASSTGSVDDTLWYDFTVTNNGVFNDDIALTILGNAWPTTIWDASASTEISSTGQLIPDEIFDFKVRVIVPDSYYGDADTAEVKAASGGNSSISESATIRTISAGEAANIPFTDEFVTTTLDPAKWVYNTGAEINDLAYSEPSTPYSLNLNGDPAGSDTVLSVAIDLKSETNVIVNYFYQQTGSGESPDTDDDLIISYINNIGDWVELNRHLGAGSDMNTFGEVELPLPADAYHSGFRIRFHNIATAGNYDDWFVDDIYVGEPSDYDFSVSPSIQSLYGPAGDSATYSVWIYNEGALADTYDLVDSIGDWDVTFFDASGSTQITTTASVPPTDSLEFLAKVAVPVGTPLHVTDTATIYVRSTGNPTITGYTLIATFSAGFPAQIPWSESFPDDTLYTQRWFRYQNVYVSALGLNEPSPQYSMNIDGDPDTATSQLIDLDGKADVYASFFYQAGGGGTMPGTGEDLVIEYRNASGNWMPLQSIASNNIAMDNFDFMTILLPVDSYHSSFQLRFRSSTSWVSGDWFIDNIRIDYAPQIDASPSALSAQLVKGDSAETDLIINNGGLGILDYDLDVIYNINPLSLFSYLYEQGMVQPASSSYPEEAYLPGLSKGGVDAYSGPEVKFNAGGPDNFGYHWIDSDEPGGPVFEWIDISATGTDIVAQLDDDNYVGPVNIGFDFKYYDIVYNRIYIGSNGIIGFLEDNMEGRSNLPIPSASAPNAILAWFWDDLDPTDPDNPGAHVYYENLGDHFVITFKNYPRYQGDPGDIMTAQVILYDNNIIKYQYQSIATGFLIESATIGIENHEGNDGLEVVYNNTYVHDNLAIQFFGQYEWFVPESYSGQIAAGGADTITCQFLSAELDSGMYSADIYINNNDPINNPLALTAELEVSSEPFYTCGDANADGNVNVSDAVLIINYVFIEGPAPDPLESGDVNCDENINVSDAVYIINYVFAEGPAPCDCP